MAQYTLGRIVPEKLIPIFESSFPDSTREITSIMHRVFPDFQQWEYLGNIKNGLIIECGKKPTKLQLQILFKYVEKILAKYPVLDLSDTISYEDYVAKIESMPSDDFIKSHQKHNERAFAELIRKNREGVAE